jgi:hypothetical protein
MTNIKFDKFLFILLAIVALLRLPLIFEGLPAVYNSTEYFMSKMALGMGARFSLDPLIYIYPTFYTYLLLFVFSILFILGYLFGIFNSTHDFAVRFLTDPTLFYLAGRIVSVFFSLLTIVLIYHFVKKFRSNRQARIAALLGGFSFSFFEFSGYSTPESLLIMMSALATAYIYQLQSEGSLRSYIIAGLLCGLAVGVKYNAGFIFLAVIVVYIQKFKQNRNYIWLALAGSLVGFLIFNPYWILKFDSFYQGFLLVADQMYSAVSTDRGVNYIWEFWTLIKTELVIGLLFLVASIWALKFDFKRNLPFVVIIIMTIAYVGSWEKKGIDYLFPVFPAWIILGSEFIDQKIKDLESKKFVFVFLFIPSAIAIVYHLILVIKDDTREIATSWIVDNVTVNERICYDNYHYDLGIFDVDRFISYGAGAAQLPAAVKEDLESYRSDERNIQMVSILFEDTINHSKTENLYEAEQEKFKRKELTQLVTEGVKYLIIRDDFYNMYKDANIEQYPSVITARINAVNKFYDNLFLNFEPSIKIPSGLWRKGPTISIYKLSGE